MSREALLAPSAPAPAGPYSQAIVSNGFVFTAGVLPRDAASGEVPETVGEQTRLVLHNIREILRHAGAELDDVIKCTVHLQNPKRDAAEFNAVYAEAFAAPYPVRTTVGSELNNVLVEIDVVAALPAR
ncbi:RidA family protein [Microbacterium esteraromaticum]|uniref:RidA family protein n=1 Tax=Microbacterium esteraromaticum TaxID=57043 RepID=A0A7D8AB56_9MICO|nr:RidA family protein [Microbacterium esteraromaticum]QMU97181.1 RidA family protein [Microbacterium esteraromaticum]